MENQDILNSIQLYESKFPMENAHLHYDMVKNRREASGALQEVVDAALQSAVAGIASSASIVLEWFAK